MKVQSGALASRGNLHVLLKPSERPGYWVAICLDRYIVAQGESEKDALRQFGAMLAAALSLGVEEGNREDPLKGIPPAPVQYWDDFFIGQPCRLPMQRPSDADFPKVTKRLAVA